MIYRLKLWWRALRLAWPIARKLVADADLMECRVRYGDIRHLEPEELLNLNTTDDA